MRKEDIVDVALEVVDLLGSRVEDLMARGQAARCNLTSTYAAVARASTT